MGHHSHQHHALTLLDLSAQSFIVVLRLLRSPIIGSLILVAIASDSSPPSLYSLQGHRAGCGRCGPQGADSLSQRKPKCSSIVPLGGGRGQEEGARLGGVDCASALISLPPACQSELHFVENPWILFEPQLLFRDL